MQAYECRSSGSITDLLMMLSLLSCPSLCDPIDGSPPGSPIPGILQARTLEWVVISFSNAGRRKAVRDRFALQGGTGDFPRDAVEGKGLILPRGGNHVYFLELRRHSRVTTGISAFPLGWPWEAQSSPRVPVPSRGIPAGNSSKIWVLALLFQCPKGS